MDIQQLKERASDLVADQAGTVALSFLDLTSRAACSIHGDLRVRSASVIKLVIMAEVLRRVETGELSLTQPITVTAEDLTGGDGILKELEPGHTFTLREIMTLMIIVSDNQATNILIGLVGMDAVNAMAQTLGLKHAHLGRRMMDGEARKQGRDNFICADDMVQILAAIYDGTLISAQASRLMLDILLRQQQMGRLQLYLPEEVPVAHKCGDLDLLENDGGIVLLPDRPYVLVVLTSDMPSNKEGREVIGLLSKLIYDQMQAQ